MILRQLFTAVLSLAVSLLIIGVAFAQDQQKKQGKPQSQKVSTPSRATPATSAPKVQLSNSPAARNTRQATPQVRTQTSKQQPVRPPATQAKPNYKPLHLPSGQTGISKPPVAQPRPAPPAAPVAKPQAQPTTPATKTMPILPTPQKDQKLAESGGTLKEAAKKPAKSLSTEEKPKNQKQSKDTPGKTEPGTSASGKHQEPAASSNASAGAKDSGAQTASPAEEKYKRNPDLANVKWSDNELREHIKRNLDTLGDKYDKNKYQNMSRKDLEQAYAKIHPQAEKHEEKDKIRDKIKDELKDLGEKYDSKKYDKMPLHELKKKYESLKDEAAAAKSSLHEKLENLSRNELMDAIAKEKGEPLNDHYKRMSKNELANELELLQKQNHEKQQISSHSHPSGTSTKGSQSHSGQEISYSSGGVGFQSFRGVLAEQYANHKNSFPQSYKDSLTDYGSSAFWGGVKSSAWGFVKGGVYGAAKEGPVGIADGLVDQGMKNYYESQGQICPSFNLGGHKIDLPWWTCAPPAQ